MTHFGRGGAAFAGNASVIVGETGNPSYTEYVGRATLWEADGSNPRVVTGLGDVASRPAAINAAGVYVGTSNPPQGPYIGRAFVGQDGTATFMNYPGFNVTHGVDVNDANWITGVWLTESNQFRGYVARAFGTEIYDIGTLAGAGATFPRAINNAGEVVGVSADRAAYWAPGATSPVDFNLMAGIDDTLVEAMDINNAGQILARGFNGYYILAPVPEPVAAGVVLLTGFRLAWRRRH